LGAFFFGHDGGATGDSLLLTRRTPA
jgi:hypothetical protein